MASFTVRGEVLPFGPNQRNIRVHNVEEMRRFWQAERIDTKLDWEQSEILSTISEQEMVRASEIGAIVDYTIEPWDRADGRRVRGVSLRVVTPAAENRMA
jgi:hypothetical protein